MLGAEKKRMMGYVARPERGCESLANEHTPKAPPFPKRTFVVGKGSETLLLPSGHTFCTMLLWLLIKFPFIFFA